MQDTAKQIQSSSAARFGLGLRPIYYHDILAQRPNVDFYEIVSENYMTAGGKPLAFLDRIRTDNSLVMHGVSLSIAGDPLNQNYLKRLKQFADRIQPLYMSDHLCWTNYGGKSSHDLLPLPYNKETLQLVIERVQQVQEFLGRRFYLENPSAYVDFTASDRNEAEFFAELCARSGCGILLDLNNVVVNYYNIGLDPYAYLDHIKGEDICYFHLAGHSITPDARIDTHDHVVPEDVWNLYAAASQRFPNVATVIERDDKFPPFAELLGELDAARARKGIAAAELSFAKPAQNIQDKRELVPSSWEDTKQRFWQIAIGSQAGFHERFTQYDQLLNSDHAVLPQRGAQIYNDAYFLRLHEIFKENFPALSWVLRGKDFADLTRGYLEQHPPSNPSVKYAMQQLADYIPRHPFSSRFLVPTQAIADLAALEWAKVDLFDAEDGPSAVSPQILAEIAPEDWPHAQFTLTPVLRLLHSDFNVTEVWTALEAQEFMEDADVAMPIAGRYTTCVHRFEQDIRFDALAPREALALASIQAGETFWQVASRLQADSLPNISVRNTSVHNTSVHNTVESDASVDDEIAAELAGYLVNWMQKDLVVGVSIAPTSAV